MKTGRTLQELAVEIDDQQKAKRDFTCPTDKLEFHGGGERGRLDLQVNGEHISVEPTQHCLRQIYERVGIPSKYAERCLATGDSMELLAYNINWWFKNTPEKRMVRTLINGQATARAFVSNRYQPRDNSDLAAIALPEMIKAGCEILSSELTETRFYIQAATPKLELDLNELRRTGAKLKDLDPVRAGVVLSNSEVGRGSLRVEPMLYRLTCLNGCISSYAIRKYHVGRKNSDELEEASEFFSDSTQKLDSQAFWAKVKDVVRATFDKGKFESLAAKFAATGEVRLEDPQAAIEEVTARYRLSDDENADVLKHLINGGDLSLFGLVNAVTRTSTDVENYDRAIELERIGGDLMEVGLSAKVTTNAEEYKRAMKG